MKNKIFALVVVFLLLGQVNSVQADNSELVELRQQVQQLLQRIDHMEQQQSVISDKLAKYEAQDVPAGQDKVPVSEQKAENKAVQVYGQVRVSVDNNSSDFGDGMEGTSIKSNSSRLGVQGTMPSVLDGTDIIYRAEMKYGAADEKDAEIEWREGFGGLKGGWGKLRLGRLSVPYKSTLTTIDPWNDNIAQSRGFGGRQGSSALHSSYFNNAVDYVSPKFYGLSASLWTSTQFDGEDSEIHNAGPINKYKGGDATGVGLRFQKAGWFASADYIDVDADTVESSNMSNGNGWQLAARYKADSWSASAFYEDVDDLGLGKNFYLNGIYKINKLRLIATYGQNRDATQYAERDIDTWSVGAKYALGDSTELFAVYNDREEDDLNYRTFSSGFNIKFGY